MLPSLSRKHNKHFHRYRGMIGGSCHGAIIFDREAVKVRGKPHSAEKHVGRHNLSS